MNAVGKVPEAERPESGKRRNRSSSSVIMWIGTVESDERRNAVPSFPVELKTFGGTK